jgi:outer membrane protein OmpA-like peptidoglycan-associated protein
MRAPHLFVATAFAGLIASAGSNVQAGPLGGLGGGIGGGLSGGLGGLSGGLNGSLDGSVQLQPGQTIDPVTGRVIDARAKVRKAASDVQTATPAVRGTVAVAPAAATAVVTNNVRTATAIGPRLAAAPIVSGAGYIANVGLVRRRQTEALIAGGVTVLAAPDAYIYMDRQADALRHELAGTGVEVVRQGDAIVLQLPSDVTFAFDKADIRERFFPVLSAVAATLNQYPATFVDVIGHTDAIGSAAYNQALSERRAAAVADFIQRREDIPARLYVAGRGKSEPIATNATVQGRAENRRVEILLHPYIAG